VILLLRVNVFPEGVSTFLNPFWRPMERGRGFQRDFMLIQSVCPARTRMGSRKSWKGSVWFMSPAVSLRGGRAMEEQGNIKQLYVSGIMDNYSMTAGVDATLDLAMHREYSQDIG
jgi:hypothetical protein